MTTTNLPKNQTGVYAGNSLQEIKPSRTQINGIPISALQQRSAGNQLAEQNRFLKSAFQSYYPYATSNGTRNGFRPSIVRRQKQRVPTAITPRESARRESREYSSKDLLLPTTPSSARLKSEIDQLNSQLKVYGDLNRILRLQNERDASATPHSALSYSTSCRISSASTNQTNSRLQPRFSSVLNNTTIDISDKSIVTSTSPINEPETGIDEIDHRFTHAFQIPQQCNVGSASIFPLNPPPPVAPLATTARSIKSSRSSNGNKSVACPFYVMYFANLTMQNRPNGTSRVPSASSTTTTTVRRTSARRPIQSPLSVSTYSTLDDDNDLTNPSTTYYNNKRFSAKMAAFENENSYLLKDVLRTTSWNHVQV